MNLISCEKCGVVFNKDNVPFPEQGYDDSGKFDDTKATWVNNLDDFAVFIKCPIDDCEGILIGDIV